MSQFYSLRPASRNHIAASILPHLIDAQSNIHTKDDGGDDNGECELTEAGILWNIDVAAGSKTMPSLSAASSFNEEKYYQLSFAYGALKEMAELRQQAFKQP